MLYFCFLIAVMMPFILAFYVSSYANICHQIKRTWMGRPAFERKTGPWSPPRRMDIGWSGESSFCPACFPQLFSEVASTVKHLSPDSLHKVNMKKPTTGHLMQHWVFPCFEVKSIYLPLYKTWYFCFFNTTVKKWSGRSVPAISEYLYVICNTWPDAACL